MIVITLCQELLDKPPPTCCRLNTTEQSVTLECIYEGPEERGATQEQRNWDFTWYIITRDHLRLSESHDARACWMDRLKTVRWAGLFPFWKPFVGFQIPGTTTSGNLTQAFCTQYLLLLFFFVFNVQGKVVPKWAVWRLSSKAWIIWLRVSVAVWISYPLRESKSSWC